MGLNVLVVGAGIAGYTSAIALRRAGHQVTILERTTNKREVGFALSIPPNCSRTLQSLGFDLSRGRLTKFGDFYSVKAEKWPYQVTAAPPSEDEAKYGLPSLAAHRVDLHEALREYALGQEGEGTPAVLREGMAVVSFNPGAGSVTLEDGSTLTADLVVAADGVKSKAHRWIIGEERPATQSVHSNVRFALPTKVMQDNPKLKEMLLNDGSPTVYYGSDPDKWLLRFPCRDNTIQNFGCYDHSHDIAADQIKWKSRTPLELLRERLVGFDEGVREIEHHVNADDMYLWGIVDRKPLPAYHKGRLVIVGDSAHPMHPTWGQGASQAIEDGAVLGVVTRGLKDATQLEDRLILWQQLRLPRTSAIQCFAYMERAGQRGKGLAGWAKDELPRVLPRDEWPETTVGGINDWCYKHDCVREAEKAVSTRFGTNGLSNNGSALWDSAAEA